jgi:hypothetical protein
MQAYINKTRRVFSATQLATAFGTSLDFHCSVTEVMLWMAIVLALSALASLWSALEVAGIGVRVSGVHTVQSRNHANQEEKDGTTSISEHGMD